MDDKKTFIMLKPDTIRRGLVYKALSYFLNNGFTIQAMDILTAQEGTVKHHYAEVIEKFGAEFEAKMLRYVAGNQVVPIVLYREQGDAVACARKILGATDPSKAEPGTVRGDLGIDSYAKCNAENRSCENLVHASDSWENVMRETALWLPDYQF